MVAIVLLPAACGRETEDPQPVTETEAMTAMGVLSSIAAKRTTHAMEELCDLSLDDCSGMSGAVLNAPESAPGEEDEPTVLCSVDAGSGAWMLVVEGQDGIGRPYASQVVFGRDGHRVVTLREPAFWLGVGYSSPKVVGSTSWSTAYHPSAATARAHTEMVLGQAHAACE